MNQLGWSDHRLLLAGLLAAGGAYLWHWFSSQSQADRSARPLGRGHPAPLYQPWHLRSRASVQAYVNSLEPETHGWLLALFVDSKLNLLAAEALGHGSISDVKVSLADILAVGYQCQASGFFLVHNRPLGRGEPTPANIMATNKLRRSSAQLGVPLVEHCIVSDDTVAVVGGLDKRGNLLPWPATFVR